MTAFLDFLVFLDLSATERCSRQIGASTHRLPGNTASAKRWKTDFARILAFLLGHSALVYRAVCTSLEAQGGAHGR
jgi:hypothetical protein